MTKVAALKLILIVMNMIFLMALVNLVMEDLLQLMVIALDHKAQAAVYLLEKIQNVFNARKENIQIMVCVCKSIIFASNLISSKRLVINAIEVTQ